MTIEELKQYCEKQLHTKIHYSLPRFPDYGVISSPVNGHWVALVMHYSDFDAMDLRYGKGARQMRKTKPYLAPFHLKGSEWVGIMLNDPANDEIIRQELSRAYQASLNTDQHLIELDDIDEGYQSQPIAFHRRSKDRPERIAAMQDLYNPALNQEENFYIQGKFMEDYEDDFTEEIILEDSSPHYHKMTDDQLRRYFTLRKGYRHHQYPKVFDCYIYLYVFELLNLIGTISVDDAYASLSEIWNHYKFLRPVKRRLEGYMQAFQAIYQGLGYFFESDEKSRAVSQLDPLNDLSARQLFDYAKVISSSPVAYKDPKRYEHLLLEVYRRLCRDDRFFETYIARRQIGAFHQLDGAYFGAPMTTDRLVFGGVNLIYKNHHWYEERYQPLDGVKKVSELLEKFDEQLAGHLSDDSRMAQVISQVLEENDPHHVSIAGMHALYSPYLRKAENFYRQGKYMADYPGENVICTYFMPLTPYEYLDDKQLNSYFYWRSQVRAQHYVGDHNYLYLYVSEIINDIGVKNPDEGLTILRELRRHYRVAAHFDEVLEQYIILHQLTAYYPKLNICAINEDYYHLDPQHLGTDEEIITALRHHMEGFGTHNCLYKGNEEAVDALIVSVYKSLVARDDFFTKYVTKVKNRKVRLYPYYLYDERHTQSVHIPLLYDVSYEFDEEKRQWYVHGYDDNRAKLRNIDSAINETIQDYYRIYEFYMSGERTDEAIIYQTVREYLDVHPLTIKDPVFKDIPILKAFLDQVIAAKKIKGHSRLETFKKQGKVMAQLHLDVKPNLRSPYQEVYCYEDLDNYETMTYLYVRDCLRRNEKIPYFSIKHFLPLYVDEIINGIGVKNNEGVKLLENLHQSSAKTYLFDYLIMHHLDGDMLAPFKKTDQQMMAIDPLFTKDPDALYDNIMQSSLLEGRYQLERSPLFKKDAALFKKLLYDVLSALSKDNHFAKKAIGVKVHKAYHPFNGLLYEMPKVYADYELSPIRRVYQENGTLYYDYYQPVDYPRVYFDIIHEIDRHARVIFGLKHPLKPRAIDQTIDAAIVRLIENFKMQQERQVQPKKRATVKIHFDDLNRIRSDALATTEQLLTEEEKEDQNQEEIITEEPASQVLTKDEQGFLQCLMNHQDIHAYAQAHHLMISVVCDHINEKLIDEIGDNVIDFAGDEPEIIEDYLEDLDEIMNTSISK